MRVTSDMFMVPDNIVPMCTRKLFNNHAIKQPWQQEYHSKLLEPTCLDFTFKINVNPYFVKFYR